MTAPSKLFAIGLIAAVACFGAGRIIVMRADTHLKSLVATCHDESERAQHSNTNVPWEKDPLVCDPRELASIGAPVGIQAQIASAYGRLLSLRQWTWLVPAAIAAASAIPFLWYFLLRRIRELSGAVIGR